MHKLVSSGNESVMFRKTILFNKVPIQKQNLSNNRAVLNSLDRLEKIAYHLFSADAAVFRPTTSNCQHLPSSVLGPSRTLWKRQPCSRNNTRIALENEKVKFVELKTEEWGVNYRFVALSFSVGNFDCMNRLKSIYCRIRDEKCY